MDLSLRSVFAITCLLWQFGLPILIAFGFLRYSLENFCIKKIAYGYWQVKEADLKLRCMLLRGVCQYVNGKPLKISDYFSSD